MTYVYRGQVMRICSFETRGGDATAGDGSVVLLQEFSHGHRRVRAFAMAFCGGLLCLPFALVLASAAARARLADLAISDPIAVAQLGIVLAIALATLYFGLTELNQPAVRKRVIRINDDQVIVEDTVRGRERRWQEPVRSYHGIRHRVLTTSAGTIHTLMLEHPHPARSLHIAYETHIANQAIVHAAGHYKLPILRSGSVGIGHRVTRALPRWLAGLSGTAVGGRRAAST